MKISAFTAAITILFLCCFGTGVSGLEESCGLSRAIDILYEQDRLEKGALPGERVSFSHLDFLSCVGNGKLEGITIRQAPSPAEGVLVMGSETLGCGDYIPCELIEKLKFVPIKADVQESSFRFSLNEGRAERVCVLRFEEAAPTLSPIENHETETYKNVSCVALSNAFGPEEKIKVSKSTRQGLIRVDPENRSVWYTPGRDFTGTDSFEYCVVSKTGEKSPLATVKISVKESAGNLFFPDCTGTSWHRAAITACEKGLVSLRIDQNGLPCFCPDAPVSETEQKALLQFGSRYSDRAVLSVFAENDVITRGTAAELMEIILRQ